MRYLEVLHLIKNNPNLKFTRDSWDNAYIIQDPCDSTKIIYHRSMKIDGNIINTDMNYFPSHSDTYADDWKEYVCI